MDKFRKKIQEQAAIKANESRSRFHGNQHVEVCSPNGDHTKIKTDKELAKMAGVGTGTVARFNKVMNSDDEELKKKVLANEVSISAGYNNFGRRKNGPSKDRKALEMYVMLRGYKNGGNRQAQCQNGTLLSLDEIAK